MSNSEGRERGPNDHSGLPANPSLEWLRKRAKDELRVLREQTPDAQLSDAQLAVARTHGFASWRKLKAFVDAVNGHGDAVRAAVRAGDVAALTALLDDDPELVDTGEDLDERERPSDERGMTLLHLAVAVNHAPIVVLLIARGARLDVRNAGGRTALHDCFELNRDAIAKLLVAAGATVDVCAAAAYGYHDRLRAILRADPGQANDMSTSLSPLGWTGFAHDAESARILIGHGAIVDRPPHDAEVWGSTCMVSALPVARVLLEAGANPNAQDERGDTPLHHAIASRLVRDPAPLVELLLDAGADPLRVNHAGESALDAALAQRGRQAETYFPAKPVGEKQLDRAIELMRRKTNFESL
ncbi:MAG TPA: ankyrin repeat domain-containing protein [Kofleriaceae bacterium]